MNIDDLDDMQRYLVEEEKENWDDGLISRRAFIRRVTLLVGGAAAATPLLLAMGCDPAAAPTATVVPATATTAPPPATATSAAPTATTAAATATSEPPTAISAQASPTTGGSAGATSPYHVDENDPSIAAEMVDLKSPDPAVRLRGYLASPGRMGPAAPGGVLVIHENRGLTDHINDVVRRVAKAGYIGLGVDLLSRNGGSEAIPDESQRTGILGQMPADQILADLSAGLDDLKGRADPNRLAVIGFCFGGGYTWRMATQRPDLRAAVPFYGPAPPLADVPNIKAAVLGIYGGNDTRINSSIPALEEALKQAGVTYEIKIYDGADHAFHNDTGARYNPSAATDAWERTLAWLQTHLAG
jgi:carboxymethylenebutenolidase